MLPIAVRRYVNPPGPDTPAPTSPCADDQTRVHGLLRDRQHRLPRHRDRTPRSGPSRPPAPHFDTANPGSDPTHHGPVVAILGQGAQPNNGADFRGFIALDIRNFQALGTQLYYNGVTAATNPTRSRTMEANWVTIGGYPGPQFPAVDHSRRTRTTRSRHERQLHRRRDRRGRRPVRRPARRSSSPSTPATSWRSRTSRSRRRRRSRCRPPGRRPARDR